jgi:hypothetical protein
MQTKRSFANVFLYLPWGWIDVTDDLPAGSPPTLSRGEKAVGALQFSTALYVTGARPPVGYPSARNVGA